MRHSVKKSFKKKFFFLGWKRKFFLFSFSKFHREKAVKKKKKIHSVRSVFSETGSGPCVPACFFSQIGAGSRPKKKITKIEKEKRNFS